MTRDIAIAESITKRYELDSKTSGLVLDSIKRILAINEEDTFAYQDLARFEKSIPKIQELKKLATESFRPFAAKHHTSLCASMGFPMMSAIAESKAAGIYEMFHEIFCITNAKAKRFGLAALYSALEGERTDVPNAGGIYNIVFDRDSPWTYRNEAEHMEEYARYHFNSYLINRVMGNSSNPFDPVISLYENGAADFIFMQTWQNGVTEEKLCTFHTVDTSAGRIIGVHMEGDDKLQHYRKWGDPYFKIRSLGSTAAKIKIIGIADQRFMPD
ncbi:MAG TPA: hypothetical protein VLF17_06105 [Candidatus Nitrosotenuis sp.]|nr:hypothetical protein [Candidatus Nitrosotenuis sp.]